MAISTAVLKRADRTHVVAAMAAFKGRPADRWLRAAHPVRDGEFGHPQWARVSQLQHTDLVSAVAMAAPNHCVDGWSYAARATSAILSGDYHGCRHLAYYAQLRAGLSILANLGVGIFNRINFVIDNNGRPHRLDPTTGPSRTGDGTHVIVWDALREWSLDQRSARLFLDLVRIRGISLSDSLSAIWPGAISAGIASQLIGSWGVDLARGKAEHRFRNISSYNPQSLNPLTTTVGDSLKLIEEFWELCEPTGSGSFDALDRFLLRNLLQSVQTTVDPLVPFESPTGAITRNYGFLSPLIQGIASLNFLTGVSGEADPALITLSKASTNPAEPTEMLARAYLLLRTATALTHASCVDAGIDLAGGDLRPWIDDLAERRGFWRPGQALDDPSDLWADVEIALTDFTSTRAAAPTSWSDWMANSQRGVPQITELERIGVWSLSV